MQAERAGAFWSYVHADDESERGRIVDLAHDVRDRYGLLTGGDLELFLDRDAIEWGNDWRERISTAISAATFFIPIMTPRYFNSVECRRELIAFAREANRHGVESLLLPILYTNVPDLEREDLADEAMLLVRPRQYENWTDLRLEDRGSHEYRKGVNRLAQRLADTMLAVSSSTPDPATTRAAARPEPVAPDDEAPGILDLIAEGEEAMPRLVDVIERLAQALEDVGRITQEVSSRIDASDRRGGGTAGRVKLAGALASNLRPVATDILRLGEENARELAAVDAAISAMLSTVEEAPPDDPEQQRQALAFFETIEQTAEVAAESTRQLSDFSGTLDQTARLSRALRPVARDLQRGLRSFGDAQAIYDEWGERIRQIRQRLTQGSDGAQPAPS
jgi:hypothetical protein